jgi:Ca-activated chloride channel family protein
MVKGSWFGTRRARHGATAAAVVLATGGLFLLHAHADAHAETPDRGGMQLPSPDVAAVLTPKASTLPPAGADTVAFSGPHVRGTLALSDARVLTGRGQQLYADISLSADGDGAEHAPLAMVVVLDTSGSMEGEKLREAKSAVKELVRTMRDEDDIAFVHYSHFAEVVEPLRRVGDVRQELSAAVDRLSASGGTAIPLGLEMGMRQLDEGLARSESRIGQRVRRVVLVSDGLDSSRARSEGLAQTAAVGGVTISTMGIGLDFDEAYMGAVARSGHGNFGFVNDGPTLTAFLKKELTETAATAAESTVVHLHLPAGVRFVRATGADADVHGADLDLRVGAIFADDTKRVLLTFETDMTNGAAADLGGSLTWTGAGGGANEATIPTLGLRATDDAQAVQATRNATVMARVASVEASKRQIEAAEAYSRGDTARAQHLIQTNIASLGAAGHAAPAPVAAQLAQQAESYSSTYRDFASAPAASPRGRYAAKAAAASNMANAMKMAF